MSKHRTTEDLREILFETIDDVRSGKLETKEAGIVLKLAEQVCKTAELEIQYALADDKLLRNEQGERMGGGIGRILLTQKDTGNGS